MQNKPSIPYITPSGVISTYLQGEKEDEFIITLDFKPTREYTLLLEFLTPRTTATVTKSPLKSGDRIQFILTARLIASAVRGGVDPLLAEIPHPDLFEHFEGHHDDDVASFVQGHKENYIHPW